MTSLRRLKRIWKRCLFLDVSDMSQKYILKVFVTIKKITQKWFRAEKIEASALKTLKNWNVVFWQQCIAINQSVMWAHFCMLLISAVWLTNHLIVFGMSTIVKSQAQVYYLPLLVIFSNDKTLYNSLPKYINLVKVSYKKLHN